MTPEAGGPTLSRSASFRRREKAEPRFTVWLGPRGAGRFGNGGAGGGGAAALGAGVRVVRGLWLAAEVAEGFYSGPGEMLGQIRLGVRYEFWTPRVRPYLTLVADHAHQQSWANTRQEPFLTLVGASDDIEHRTGPGLGLGVKIPLSTSDRGFLRYFAVQPQVDFAYYVDTKANPAVVSGSILLAATF